MLMMRRDSILLLLVDQVLLVLILDLFEVIEDLGNLFLVSGDTLIEKKQRLRNNLQLADNLLEVLSEFLVLPKASASMLFVAVGIRFGRDNNSLRSLSIIKASLRGVVVETSGLSRGLGCLHTLSWELIVSRSRCSCFDCASSWSSRNLLASDGLSFWFAIRRDSAIETWGWSDSSIGDASDILNQL